MEMRLGKSLVAIRWVQRTVLRKRPNARILVLCPTSAFEGWLSELPKEGVPASRIHWLTGRTADRIRYSQEGRPGWYITNWEAVSLMGVRFADQNWDVIICDESTAIRNPRAKVTKTLQRMYADIEYRAIMTGLPNPESSMDYFEQMRFLHGSFLGFDNYYAFRFKLFKQVGYDWLPLSGVRDRIKEAVHRDAFVLTAKQAGLGNRLVYEPRYVDPTPEILRHMKDVKKDFRFEDITTKWAPVRELWLQRLAGGFSPDRESPRLISNAKISELWTLLSGELKGQQVVIWFRFLEELEAVRKMLHKRRVDTGGIMGSVPVADRRQTQQQFQSGRFPYLLCQLQTGKGGMGQDFSAASTAIYYSNVYEYEIRAQSEKRIEHPTKNTGLLIIDLLTRRTVDVDAYAVLRDKRREAGSFSRALWSRILQNHLAPDADPVTIRQKVKRIFPGQMD